MCIRWYGLVMLLAGAGCLPGVAVAQTPIHRCKDADGGVVYSQLPCKDEAPAEQDAAQDAEDEPESPEPLMVPVVVAPPDAVQDEAEPDESTAACQKRYRDAIDEIDAEIRREYAPEKDAEYKQRLLALTRKLRAC